MRIRRRLGVVLGGMLAVACNLPRDPDRTLDRVTRGTIHVGVIHNPPWVVDTGTTVDGIEPRLVNALAGQLHARVDWVRGPAPELFERLHERRLQLVIGGLTDTLVWRQRVAFTRPYFQHHILAAPPGENAWLVRVEQMLYERADALVAMAAERR